MTLLEVRSLSAGYGPKRILQDLSFRVEQGSLVGLLGVNGCGKTTLLKALGGIVPSRGEISLLGHDPRSISPRALAGMCSYIPQRSGISIDLSVLDVVLMGFNPKLRLLEYPGSAMVSSAREALERVGLGDRAESNFQTLSEGQKQLCILARAMLLDHGLMLMDEPESSLDFSGRYRVLELMRDWISRREGAALVTLHDPQLALNTCDRLLLLRDGRIWDSISPGTDPVEETERRLSAVFGGLSVHRVKRRDGRAQLVLIREDTEWKP